MDSFQFMFISSFSVLIPLFFVIVNFKKIERNFYPLVCLLFINMINEIIIWISLGTKFIDGSQVYNVYFLFEALIITWQFKRWGLFHSKKWLLFLFVSLYLVAWISDGLFFAPEGRLYSYYIIFYSFLVILMSLNMLYYIFKEDSLQIVDHPIFIISITFLFFFVYTIITEVLTIYPKTSVDFRWNILNLLNVINILCNIGYAFAIFQISKRQKFYMTLEREVVYERTKAN